MMIAYQGEEIKDRHGKVIATVAEDITSPFVTPKQLTMAKGHELTGGFIPDEVMDFIRGRLTRGAPKRTEAKAAPKAKKAPAKKKAKK